MTVSWSYKIHPFGEDKPVYERSTFPLTAKEVVSADSFHKGEHGYIVDFPRGHTI